MLLSELELAHGERQYVAAPARGSSRPILLPGDKAAMFLNLSEVKSPLIWSTSWRCLDCRNKAVEQGKMPFSQAWLLKTPGSEAVWQYGCSEKAFESKSCQHNGNTDSRALPERPGLRCHSKNGSYTWWTSFGKSWLPPYYEPVYRNLPSNSKRCGKRVATMNPTSHSVVFAFGRLVLRFREWRLYRRHRWDSWLWNPLSNLLNRSIGRKSEMLFVFSINDDWIHRWVAAWKLTGDGPMPKVKIYLRNMSKRAGALPRSAGPIRVEVCWKNEQKIRRWGVGGIK